MAPRAGLGRIPRIWGGISMLEPIVIGCLALLVLSLGADLALRKVKFTKTDAKLERLARKYKYTGF